MKRILFILLLSSLFACEKHEFPSTKITYPYEPEQETIINIDVVPVGDVVMEFKDMDLEVNADYFNRYGIGVRLHLKDGMPLSNDLPFIDDKIVVYVVPYDYITEAGTQAYYIMSQNNGSTKTKIILGEGHQKNKVLAHELGHAYGLNHVNIKNNVMQNGNNAFQYDIPHDFLEKQIDTIMSNISWYK